MPRTFAPGEIAAMTDVDLKRNFGIDTAPMLRDVEFAGLDNPNHRPYCLHCGTFSRMVPKDGGFLCDPALRDHVGRRGCGNFYKPESQEQIA